MSLTFHKQMYELWRIIGNFGVIHNKSHNYLPIILLFMKYKYIISIEVLVASNLRTSYDLRHYLENLRILHHFPPQIFHFLFDV